MMNRAEDADRILSITPNIHVHAQPCFNGYVLFFAENTLSNDTTTSMRQRDAAKKQVQELRHRKLTAKLFIPSQSRLKDCSHVVKTESNGAEHDLRSTLLKVWERLEPKSTVGAVEVPTRRAPTAASRAHPAQAQKVDDVESPG